MGRRGQYKFTCTPTCKDAFWSRVIRNGVDIEHYKLTSPCEYKP